MDDTAADFSAGTPSDTVVRDTGSVELARTLEEQFNGAPWTSTPWGADGTSSVANGSMLVDGARADSGVSTGPGVSLEFTATFGTEPFQHVGFGTDFNVEPWAMFSTGLAGGGKVFARISGGAGSATDVNVDLGELAGQPHRYRIDWTQEGFAFFVDDNPVAIPPASLTNTMGVRASDFTFGGGGVSIDSIALNTHKTPGKFTSRTMDAGDARVTSLSFASTGDPTITYETRTADAADGFTDDWQPLAPGGAVASPPKRYLQYRATLSTTDLTATPRLDKVEVGFTIDDQAPVLAIGGLALSGRSATLRFSADDASAKLECKLDGAGFGDCTSPAEFGSLADGPHTIVVRATDARGNSASATKAFVVDATAPKVTIGDVAVSGISAKVTFSSTEAASFACKLDGGAFQRCTSPATFNSLAAGSHTVVVRGTDARGNAGTATRAFMITPAGGSTPPPSTTPDLSAPEVLVTHRSVRVSKRGYAKVRVECPATEASCNVTLKLKRKGKRIARKSATLAGGAERTVRLRLSSSARRALAERSRLKVTAVVVAVDAAGNRKTKQLRMTLRAPGA